MKDWILTIGIDKFYLTELEKNFYLESLSKGSKYVVIGDDKVLGSNFQSLVKSSTYDEAKNLAAGKWKCNQGKWHIQGFPCVCDMGSFKLIDPMRPSNQLPASEEL